MPHSAAGSPSELCVTSLCGPGSPEAHQQGCLDPSCALQHGHLCGSPSMQTKLCHCLVYLCHIWYIQICQTPAAAFGVIQGLWLELMAEHATNQAAEMVRACSDFSMRSAQPDFLMFSIHKAAGLHHSCRCTANLWEVHNKNWIDATASTKSSFKAGFGLADMWPVFALMLMGIPTSEGCQQQGQGVCLLGK